MKTFNKFLTDLEVVQEKLITFGKQAYPKFGNVVILAGGAGSSKDIELAGFRYICAMERKEPVTSFTPFISVTKKFTETEDEYKARIKEEFDTIVHKLEDAKREYNRLIKKNAPSNSKFLIDVKSINSIISKISRGKKPDKITDVLRGAILVKDKEDVDKVVANLKRNAKIFEHEYKAPGSDPKYGYHGSHHFLVQVGEGFIAEIQVMTKKLWAYKEEAHKIYDKYREGKLDDYFDSEIQRSRELFKKGNK